MAKNASNPNIEWKKTGFETQTRESRKVDARKANEFEAAEKQNVLKQTPITPAALPNGINKIRKKIREVYDDYDEDEDEYQIAPINLESHNSLLDALNEEEKKFLKIQDEQVQNQALQDVSRINVMQKAVKAGKEIGLKESSQKRIAKRATNAKPNDKNAAIMAVAKEVQAETGLKIKGVWQDRELKNLSKGIREIKKVSGEKSLKSLDIKDVIELGKKGKDAEEREVAELILEKTGREESKKVKAKRLKGFKMSKKDRQYVEQKIKERE